MEGEVIEKYLDQSEGRGFRHEIQSVNRRCVSWKGHPFSRGA